MIKSSDPYSPPTKEPDAALHLLMNIMREAGHPEETVQGFLMADHDLENLCDPVLSEFAVPSGTAGAAKRSR